MKNVIEVKKLRKKYKNGFELDLDELKNELKAEPVQKIKLMKAILKYLIKIILMKVLKMILVLF